MYIRILDRLSLEEATKFIQIIQDRVTNKSKSNIFLVCLNVVKIGCLLIQIIERLSQMYPVLRNRVFEIRKTIIEILTTYLEDIKTIEEVRHLLLSQDLDYRDSLTYISEYSILELLQIPLVSEVADEIWKSRYNLRGSIFIASTNHNLLFGFNHTRYDLEGRSRFYMQKDIKAYGCHSFQFLVWRNSARSRYYAELLTVLLFVILAHVWIIDYLGFGDKLRASYKLWLEETDSTKKAEYLLDLNSRGLDIYYKALDLTYLGFVFCQLFLQNIFRSIFTGYKKQMMIFYTFENFIDAAIFFLFLLFITITYRLNLAGTWFRTYSDLEESEIFRDSYLNDNFNEDTLIVICGITLWIKIFYSLRLTPMIGPIFMLAYHIIFDLIGYF